MAPAEIPVRPAAQCHERPGGENLIPAGGGAQ